MAKAVDNNDILVDLNYLISEFITDSLNITLLKMIATSATSVRIISHLLIAEMDHIPIVHCFLE